VSTPRSKLPRHGGGCRGVSAAGIPSCTSPVTRPAISSETRLLRRYMSSFYTRVFTTPTAEPSWRVQGQYRHPLVKLAWHLLQTAEFGVSSSRRPYSTCKASSSCAYRREDLTLAWRDQPGTIGPWPAVLIPSMRLPHRQLTRSIPFLSCSTSSPDASCAKGDEMPRKVPGNETGFMNFGPGFD
jgi:hypothetical protein